jgi:hypothetical protein
MVVVRSITRINSFCGQLRFWLTNGFYARFCSIFDLMLRLVGKQTVAGMS